MDSQEEILHCPLLSWGRWVVPSILRSSPVLLLLAANAPAVDLNPNPHQCGSSPPCEALGRSECGSSGPHAWVSQVWEEWCDYVVHFLLGGVLACSFSVILWLILGMGLPPYVEWGLTYQTQTLMSLRPSLKEMRGHLSLRALTGFPGRWKRWHSGWALLFCGSQLSPSSHKIGASTSIMAWDSSFSADLGSRTWNQGFHLPQTPQAEVRGTRAGQRSPGIPRADSRGGITCGSLYHVWIFPSTPPPSWDSTLSMWAQNSAKRSSPFWDQSWQSEPHPGKTDLGLCC